MLMKVTKSLMIVVLIGFMCFIFACDDGGSSHSISPADDKVEGGVQLGYVEDATVFADKTGGAATGNFEVDNDEVWTTSDDGTRGGNVGDFTLIVPAGYEDYVLCSIGGIDTLTNEPASPMLAPAGAENITPVTTLITLKPELKEMIGDDWDADIAHEDGVDSDILHLAKTVETILNIFTNEDAPIVSDINDKFAIFEIVANSFVAADDLTNNDEVVEKATEAVSNILDNEVIVGSGTIVDADAIEDAVVDALNVVELKCPEGEIITENEISNLIGAAVGEAKTIVEEKTTTVSIKVTGVDLKSDTIDFTVEANNEFDDTKTYDNNASVTMTITDKNSEREATTKLTDVTVAVDSVNSITIDTSISKLMINGKNSAGEKVDADIDNGDGIISIVGNVVTVDIVALQDTLQDILQEDNDLYEIQQAGDYTINLSANGVPLAPYSESDIVVVE